MPVDPVAIHRILSGEDRSPRAMMLREMAAMTSPIYAGAMLARNAAYEGMIFRTHFLGRPTISVGNITTGGTGKTPVVRWLADRLRKSGRRPAVLMRGYRPTAAGVSDEQVELDRLLNADVGAEAAQRILVVANPDRVAGAAAALAADPGINCFVLDDGFQHRRAARVYDLVLINAAEPFGLGRVLPRGFLREPMRGLRRASGFLITRSSTVSVEAMAKIEAELRRRNPAASIFHCDHEHAGLVRQPGGEVLPMAALGERPFFAFCALGDPESFGRQLQAGGGRMVGSRWFADHHEYSDDDLRQLRRAAKEVGAQMLVTSQKDWTKIASMSESASEIPICVTQLQVAFAVIDEERLAAEILSALSRSVSGLA